MLERSKLASAKIAQSIRRRKSAAPLISSANHPRLTPVRDFSYSSNNKRQKLNLKNIDLTKAKLIGLSIIKSPAKIFKGSFFKSKKFQFILLPMIIVGGITFYAYHWYFYQTGSKFNATLKYKAIQINETRTVSSTSSADLQTVVLQAEDATSTFVEATGEKPTGEKSVGTISIFNNSNAIKIIKKDTVVTCISGSCNGLNYITGSDVNIGPGDSGKVQATAQDIGLNYNINPGAFTFRVPGLSQTANVFVEEMKGGTEKKMIKIVSANDIKKAEDESLSTLKTRLLEKIKIDPANQDFIFADSTLNVQKISSEPDTKVGEEADFLNVTVKAKATISALPKSNIQNEFNKLVAEVTPQGYALTPKDPKLNYKILTQTAEKIEVSISLESKAIPIIDIKSVQQQLAGKNFKSADEILMKVPNITTYTKDYSPKSLPQFFWKIPNAGNRIQITLIEEK